MASSKKQKDAAVESLLRQPYPAGDSDGPYCYDKRMSVQAGSESIGNFALWKQLAFSI